MEGSSVAGGKDERHLRRSECYQKCVRACKNKESKEESIGRAPGDGSTYFRD